MGETRTCVWGTAQDRRQVLFIGFGVFFAAALYFIMQLFILHSALIHGALSEAYNVKPVKCVLDECFMCVHNYFAESVLSAFKCLFPYIPML